MTNQTFETARGYNTHQQARIDSLRDSNHAHQCRAICRRCSLPFDVGWERLTHPVFQPLCSPECFTAHHKETR